MTPGPPPLILYWRDQRLPGGRQDVTFERIDLTVSNNDTYFGSTLPTNFTHRASKFEQVRTVGLRCKKYRSSHTISGKSSLRIRTASQLHRGSYLWLCLHCRLIQHGMSSGHLQSAHLSQAHEPAKGENHGSLSQVTLSMFWSDQTAEQSRTHANSVVVHFLVQLANIKLVYRVKLAYEPAIARILNKSPLLDFIRNMFKFKRATSITTLC